MPPHPDSETASWQIFGNGLIAQTQVFLGELFRTGNGLLSTKGNQWTGSGPCRSFTTRV